MKGYVLFIASPNKVRLQSDEVDVNIDLVTVGTLAENSHPYEVVRE